MIKHHKVAGWPVRILSATKSHVRYRRLPHNQPYGVNSRGPVSCGQVYRIERAVFERLYA